MKVLILGADGYLGWPSCMHFAARGYDVTAVDNYYKRSVTDGIGAQPLLSVPLLQQRAEEYNRLSAYNIQVEIGDICDAEFLNGLFKRLQPDVVVHYAEQPSAPYSMMDQDKAVDTLKNNLVGTLNLAYAVHQYAPDCHIIKLGTMGEYGTPNIDITEGWIDIEKNGRSDRFLFPRQASSLYHTTKIQDTDLLWFYVRTWGLRVTDLMQGPVYGIHSGELDEQESLYSGFHYDELFGTIVNRFVVQAVCGYPLTVYGSGKQVRGYLNLKDTLACVRLATENPAPAGEMRIYNQISETFSVNQLADMIQQAAAEMDIPVEIKPVANPRVESEEHYYNPSYSALQDMGLEVHHLNTEVLQGMLGFVQRHKDKIDPQKILRGISWKTSNR